MGKNKSYTARKNKECKRHPYRNPDKEHKLRKLKLFKNSPKNWLEKE